MNDNEFDILIALAMPLKWKRKKNVDKELVGKAS